MRYSQRLLLAVFLPLTAVIIILDNFFTSAGFVFIVKFFTIFFLFLAACLIKKKYTEQVLMNAAVFFALLGEFFLCMGNLQAPFLAGKSHVYGAFWFMLAYGALIVAFNRGAGRGGLPAAVAVLAVALPVFIALHSYISQRSGEVLLFYSVLCCMSWCSFRTLGGRHYGRGASRRMALAGFLLLVSDSGVAMSIFHPSFSGHFIPWLEIIIWGAYVPAWTLIVYTMDGDDLLCL